MSTKASYDRLLFTIIVPVCSAMAGCGDALSEMGVEVRVLSKENQSPLENAVIEAVPVGVKRTPPEPLPDVEAILNSAAAGTGPGGYVRVNTDDSGEATLLLPCLVGHPNDSLVAVRVWIDDQEEDVNLLERVVGASTTGDVSVVEVLSILPCGHFPLNRG
jgi:hypothetical protein